MKKKFLSLAVLALLFVSIFAGTALAKTYTLASKATLYDEPDGDNIGSIPAGDTVDVISKGSTWTKIEVGSAGHPYGYIKTKHLKTSGSSTSYKTYYIKESSVKVYAHATSSASVEGRLGKGDVVKVMEISDGWAKIVWGGADHAYVKSKYISRTKPGSGSSSESTAVETYDVATVFQKMSTVNYRAYVTPNATSSFVNFRWGPSKQSAVKGIRYNGAVVTVLAQDSSWCQVLDESTREVGYIMRRFLTPIAQ